MSARAIVHRFIDGESVAKNVAVDLIALLQKLLSEKPEVHIALTGGTVGIASLAAIAENSDHVAVDFKRVHFWWGDERFVDSNSAERNAVQATKALLSKLDLDAAKVHEFPAADQGLTLDEACEAFTKKLALLNPHFDLMLLGMGPDGHINSLFPGKPIPDRGVKVIAEHDSPKPPPQRLSFTYEVVNSADQIWFTVAGADKQEAVSVAFGDSPEDLPVGRVHGVKETHWYLDSTAGTTVFGC